MLRNALLGSTRVFFADDPGSLGGAGGGGGGVAVTPRVDSPPPPATPPAPAPGGTPPAGTAPPKGATLAEDPAGAAANAAAAAGVGAGKDNWRALLAGGDDAALKDLAKYTDPTAVYKSLRSLQADISAGKLRAPAAPLPANATDEQKAAWRQAQGLPAAPEGYVEKLQLANGLVLPETDKPIVAGFAKAAFDAGLSQDAVNVATNWYFQEQQRAAIARQEADGVAKQEAMQVLMSEWGPADYKTNMNAVVSFLAKMPDDVRDVLVSARTLDGRPLGSTPEFNRAIAAYEREMNPAATLVPSSSNNAFKSMSEEISHIDGIYAKAMQGDRDAYRQYYGHEGKPGLDVRQRELIEAQQKMSERGRAA